MRNQIEKLIVRMYQLLPKSIQGNQRIIDFISPIAEKRLSELKREVLQANWKKVELEKQVKQYRVKE